MAFKIYTKTGDKGKTSLIGGTKVPKSHLRIESYGTVDELNSYIGLCCDHLTDSSSKILLKEILWIEAYDIYAMIKTAAGQYLLSHSLKVVEEKFPSSHFIRVHRSFIVNKEKIDAIEESDLIIAGTPIPVGKTYREGLMKKLSVL